MVGLIQGPAGNPANSYLSITANSNAAGALASSPWGYAHEFHEMVASTAESWGGFYITGWTVNWKSLIHVAKGSPGNEKIFASVHGVGASHNQYVPIPIPAGTRLSIAVTSEFDYSSWYGNIEGIAASNFKTVPNITRMDVGPFNLAADTSTYLKGVTVDAGGTANTKSAWTEISQTAYTGNILQGDSLPYRYKYLGYRIEMDDSGTTTQAPNFLVDLAYGPSGSEVAFIENKPVVVKSYSQVSRNEGHAIKWFPWNRPAGDRISARIQCDNITATERELQFWLYGLR